MTDWKKIIFEVVLMLVVILILFGVATVLFLPRASAASAMEKFGEACIDWAKSSCSIASYVSDEFEINTRCIDAFDPGNAMTETERCMKCCSICKNGCNEINAETKRSYCQEGCKGVGP